ncbi:hypothetical protein [Dyella silvae]|uniref:hypothetical protein n=1 Tax=Dyella silvae TaxID=2994424 RepID=UPI0022652EBF|nr:hypothetical protein [Dyella silvae]
MKTSLHTVLCIAIRLGAVLMAVGLIEQWPRLLLTQADGRVSVAAIAFDLLGLLLAFVLWIRPGLLAWWAAGNAHRETLDVQISAMQLQYIALSVAGVYKLISGLSGVLAHGLNLLEYQHALDASGVPVSLPPYEKTLFVEYIVATIAGLALTLGARGLTGYLQRIRGGNSPMVASEQVDDVSNG